MESQPSSPDDDARNLIKVAFLAALVGTGASGSAFLLQKLIALFLQVCWFGTFSTVPREAFEHARSWPVALLLPVGGAIVIGIMARWGTPKIRGHGIPEVMESVLLGESRIAPRVAILKPLSAAISIGSGGPFGAEGPIIATGGALGSLVGQWLPVTTVERKVLLAAGAAAGMSAMFGSPVAAVILAVELLLFEMRPRSLVPVAIASTIAYVVSRTYAGEGALFPMAVPRHAADEPLPLLACCVLGLIAGAGAIGITKVVYKVEDGFEKLKVHWMWWPAIGAVAVGAIGLVEPRALAVGYSNIGQALKGELTLTLCASICVFKLIAWAVSLGSGTSGGVLAPVLTVGATLGAASGLLLERWAPAFSPGVGVAALAVMAGTFAGTARAPIATVVFALELTHNVAALPAVLASVAVAQLVSITLLRHSIMTERLARRGIPIGHEYVHDVHAVIRVRDVMTREVVQVPTQLPLEELRRWFAPDGIRTLHQAYPVVAPDGRLVGVVTRKDLEAARDVTGPVIAQDVCAIPPIVAYDDEYLESAKERLAAEKIGRLIIVERARPGHIAGILSRSDVIEALRRVHARAATAETGDHAFPTTATAAEGAVEPPPAIDAQAAEKRPIG